MSSRKHYRARVRAFAEAHHMKPSRAVHYWRQIANVYADFVGMKKQPKGSTQPILKYPVPVIKEAEAHE